MDMLRILLIEDNLADTEMSVREMKRGGLDFDWRRVETEADLRRVCAEFERWRKPPRPELPVPDRMAGQLGPGRTENVLPFGTHRCCSRRLTVFAMYSR